MRRLGVSLLALLLLPGSAARADYKETYKKALALLDRKPLDPKGWGDVEALMRQAIAEQPREGDEIKLYGMRFEPYLPHYYLGLARFELGDCASAVKEWEVSLQQGAIKGNERRTLQQDQKTCETRMAAATPSPSPQANPGLAPALRGAQSELARAEDLSREVAALQADPDLQKAGDPTLAEASRRAQETLASARTRVEAAGKATDVKPATDARDAASQAVAALEDVKRQALVKRDEARRRLAVTPSSPSPPARTAQAVPADLVQGAQAYFDGRYRDALGLLEKPAALSETPPVAAQGCLFRAAARYALFLVGAEREEPLKLAASDDVRACKRLGVAGPDPRVFSPRFVEFFKAKN
jgi:hypothetical protein